MKRYSKLVRGKSSRRLPKRLRFCGFIVGVKLVTQTELRAACGDPEADLEGVWNQADMKIYILKSLPTYRKVKVLLHEMAHMALDLGDSL